MSLNDLASLLKGFGVEARRQLYPKTKNSLVDFGVRCANLAWLELRPDECQFSDAMTALAVLSFEAVTTFGRYK
jgi:hypothetical protein